MGIYGKYTTMVTMFSCVQMSVGVLMIAFGVAFRVLVCSWITDACFGFWVGFLVLIGGIIGYCSSTKDKYSFIGYYLCFNTFCIMFAFLVIFCHSLACVHFMHQMTTLNTTSANSTNTSHTVNGSTTTVLQTTTTSEPTLKPTPTRNNTNNSTPTVNATVGANHTTPLRGSKRNCYTHQTWSDYENGRRGMAFGTCMMFLCVIEVLMSILSMMCTWAATKVEPTGIPRKKARIQGTVSEMLAAQNSHEMVARRRHGSSVWSNGLDVGNLDGRQLSHGELFTTGEAIQEAVVTPTTSVTDQSPEEPTSWYLTTA